MRFNNVVYLISSEEELLDTKKQKPCMNTQFNELGGFS